MKVRAAVLHEARKPLEIEEVDLEAPKVGEVRVRWMAAGVCHSDYHAMSGDLPARMPIVLGHEGAGVLDAVGPGVTSVQTGDRVVSVWKYSCGACEHCRSGWGRVCPVSVRMRAEGSLADGTCRFRKDGRAVHHHLGVSTFSEASVVAERSVLKIREEMPFDKAAVVSCAVVTGVGAVINGAQARPGESVVIFGVGGVGLNAVQGAALVNADPIIAVDLVDGKLATAKKFGATHLINAATEDPVARVREMTRGLGAHYAVEAIGLPAVALQAFDCVRAGGTVVMVGLTAAQATAAIPTIPLVTQEKKLAGSTYGSSDPRDLVPRLIDLSLAGKLNLDDLLSRSYRLDQINEAYDALLRGEVARSVIAFVG